MININKVVLVLAFVTLVGCNRPEAPAATGASQEVAQADSSVADTTTPTQAAPANQYFGEELMWLDTLPECDPDQHVGKIHWSEQAVAQGPVTIELGDEPGAAIFAQVGTAGSKDTGPWAARGQVIVMRAADGVVLSRQAFQGPEGCEG